MKTSLKLAWRKMMKTVKPSRQVLILLRAVLAKGIATLSTYMAGTFKAEGRGSGSGISYGWLVMDEHLL